MVTLSVHSGGRQEQSVTEERAWSQTTVSTCRWKAKTKCDGGEGVVTDNCQCLKGQDERAWSHCQYLEVEGQDKV